LPEYADDNRVVFVNGRFSRELSKLTDGVGTLADDFDSAQRHLAQYAPYNQQPFVALNTAFIEDGAFIRIPRGKVIEQPLHIVYLTMPGARPVAVHPRTLIVAGPASQCTIVESYIGLGDESYLNNAVTEVVAGDSAVVDHYKIGMEGRGAYHVGTLQAQVGKSGNFSSHSIDLAGAFVRNDSNAVLSEGSEATLNGLYIVT